jgi:hypothetical protein
MPRTARPAGHPPQAGVAPGQLEMVQAFVNTLDIEQGTDELSTPSGRQSWLGSAESSGTDIRRAMTLREALRGVLRSHVSQDSQPGGAADRGTGTGPPRGLPGRADGLAGLPGRADELAGPVAELRQIASALPARLSISDNGQVAVSPAGSGAAAALARVMLAAAEAATTGSWARLKVCTADDCQWAFYDRSPTRSGCWCSMRICGARAKSRAYRQRAAARS